MHTVYKLKYRANGVRMYGHTRSQESRDNLARDLGALGIIVECYQSEVEDAPVAETAAPAESGGAAPANVAESPF
jgi:hypothetical protein